MVKRRSEEKRIQDMVELGRDNLRLYPKVKNWCRHIDLQLVSSGMLADFYQLPIGMVAISCEHAEAGGIQAMQLLPVATSFIVRNCRECPHHEMVDVDNVGLAILGAWEEERKETGDGDTFQEPRTTIQNLASGDLLSALRTENITEQSILDLIVLLEDPDRKKEAARKLVSASEIAAELFSELALKVLCGYFRDPEVGALCFECVRNVTKRTDFLPDEVVAAARDTVESGPNKDEACFVIGDWVEIHGLPSEGGPLVDSLLSVQWHGHIPGTLGRPAHPGSTYALERIAKIDLVPLVASLKRRLGTNDKWIRVNASGGLCELLPKVPEVGPPLTSALIESLELDDDPYDGSADHAACNALGHIYILYPEETEKELRRGYEQASQEAKGLIYVVYDKVVRLARWPSPDPESTGPEKKAIECLDRIIPILLGVIAESGHLVSVKFQAAETLELMAPMAADLLATRLDALMGTLALMLEEEENFDQSQPEGILAQLDKEAKLAQYQGISGRLTRAIETVAELRPSKMLETLRQVLGQLPSDDSSSGRFKGRLVTLYGRLGSRDELAKEVIPDLYRYLMDYDSVVVRGRAVEALEELLRCNRAAVPEGMIDVLLLQLRDQYVFVHKRAVRAVKYAYTSTILQAAELCEALIVLDEVYSDDPYYVREVVRALIHVATPYPDLLWRIAPLLIKHCRSENASEATDALEEFTQLLRRMPAMAPIYILEVLNFIGRIPRDKFEHYPLSHRARFLGQIALLPRDAFEPNLDALRKAAMARAIEDGWEAIRLVELLASFEFHEEAADLAVQIAQAQPQARKHRSIIKSSTGISLLERAESLISEGKVNRALEILKQAEEVFLEDESDDHDIEDLIRTLSVAQTIARDIGQV